MTATGAEGGAHRRGGSPPPRRRTVGLVAALAVALLGLSGCDLPEGFHDYVVFDGLQRPTAVEFSPDGRVFVTEKRGVVKVFDGVEDTTPTVVACACLWTFCNASWSTRYTASSCCGGSSVAVVSSVERTLMPQRDSHSEA